MKNATNAYLNANELLFYKDEIMRDKLSLLPLPLVSLGKPPPLCLCSELGFASWVDVAIYVFRLES